MIIEQLSEPCEFDIGSRCIAHGAYANVRSVVCEKKRLFDLGLAAGRAESAARIAELEATIRECPAFGDHDLICEGPRGFPCTCWSGKAMKSLKTANRL